MRRALISELYRKVAALASWHKRHDQHAGKPGDNYNRADEKPDYPLGDPGLAVADCFFKIPLALCKIPLPPIEIPLPLFEIMKRLPDELFKGCVHKIFEENAPWRIKAREKLYRIAESP